MTHEQIRDLAIQEAARAFQVPPELIIGRLRPDPVVKARHCVAALLRINFGLKSTTIGRLTNRDHGTILNSVTQHINLTATSMDYRLKSQVVVANVEAAFRDAVNRLRKDDASAAAVILGEDKL